jgi:hypothetical protein
MPGIFKVMITILVVAFQCESIFGAQARFSLVPLVDSDSPS